jgi:hypothetical protein
MPASTALDARCAYALYKVLGPELAGAHRDKALKLANGCGYAGHPGSASPLLTNEPELLAAYQSGWERRAEEVRPRTDAELNEAIDRMAREANHGCGLFYELYQQGFTDRVDDWLERLSEDEQKRALVLLQGSDYNPQREGYWTYDPEENDVEYHPYAE